MGNHKQFFYKICGIFFGIYRLGVFCGLFVISYNWLKIWLKKYKILQCRLYRKVPYLWATKQQRIHKIKTRKAKTILESLKHELIKFFFPLHQLDFYVLHFCLSTIFLFFGRGAMNWINLVIFMFWNDNW